MDITKDVSAAVLDFKPGQGPEKTAELPKINGDDLQKVADVINNAKRPVIYFGGGVPISNAERELNELIEESDIPATYTLMAAGSISCNNPKNMGLIGMHGTIAANTSIDKADVLIALGTRFSDRFALNPSKFAKKPPRFKWISTRAKSTRTFRWIMSLSVM